MFVSSLQITSDERVFAAPIHKNLAWEPGHAQSLN